jgi:antitoxin component of MazEF toxin-antitoxin module
MSEQYEIRKVRKEDQKGVSKGVTIPHKFLEVLDISSGDYVKIRMDGKGEKRIWIEKVQG